MQEVSSKLRVGQADARVLRSMGGGALLYWPCFNVLNEPQWYDADPSTLELLMDLA